MHTPISTREINGGIQRIYRFPNGFGASVVRHAFSYGGDIGLWELAVIQFDPEFLENNDRWLLTYETPITDDVLGYLSDEQVNETLNKISALPATEAA